ncbi:TRAP transporter small permease [Tritonibacter horizontis]|uniref:TRAP transporter small permease protein n=1 Tax=Tritonibacter horizontis TaxID=1768241 RepID=A0A132C1Y1_9RHOB|nr:TRAP transporter small permease [Tritonibacter horizontis]KUP94506.1 tripartite ATP-independent periplasmic transporter, DctQ component [Tritonibacter horizontis]
MLLIRLSDGLTRSLMVLGAIWAFALCFLILADIIFRALGTPLSGTKELVANSVVIIVFMQIGFAVRSGSMLRATFLVDMLPPRLQRLLFILCLVAGAGIFFFLLHAAITPALRSFANGEFDGEGALRVPVWPARFAILFGAGLAGVNYLILLLAELLGLRLGNLTLWGGFDV